MAAWAVGLLLSSCAGNGSTDRGSPVMSETVLLAGRASPTATSPRRAVVRRLSGGTWSETSLPVGLDASRITISGFAYSGPDTIWAWSAGGESAGIVLVSVDDGRSFEEVRDFIPTNATYGPPSICDLRFVAETDAWLITEAHPGLVSPVANGVVFHSTTTGRTWESTEVAAADDAPATSSACSEPWNGAGLLARAGHVEMVRNPQGALSGARPTRVHRLPDPEGTLVRPASEQFFATAWAASGDRGWISGLFEPNEGVPKVAGRLGIVTAIGDSTWEEQPLPSCPGCFIARVEFTPNGRGVACGHRADAAQCDRQPLCLFARDGGTTWRESRMPNKLRGLRITTLALSDDGEGAIATADARDCVDDATPTGVLLESTDGGATWNVGTSPVEGGFRATALTRSP